MLRPSWVFKDALFSLALKNILFYKSRSITTVVLTFFSTFFFIVYVSMMDGSHESMLQNALKVYTGAIEIYKKGYRDEGGNEYLIHNVSRIGDVLQNIEGVRSFSSRYETYGLLCYKEHSAAAMVAGIEPEKEALQLKTALIEGVFLNADSKNCLYMGNTLVKKLHLRLGDELSFIGAASDSSFAADIFKVCGIFKTGSYEFDASSAFISQSYFELLMLSKDTASYLHVNLNHLSDADIIQKKIKSALNDATLEVLTWKKLMAPMVQAMEVDSVFGYVSMALFFTVIFFVIMIFTFINVSSRLREFGTLRAIGLSRANVRALLFYEIFLLSTFGVILASPLGAFVAYYFSVHPIVIEGMSEMYKEYGIVSDELPFCFDLFTITWNVALIYFLNILSILYPLRYVNRFTPIEALKHV